VTNAILNFNSIMPQFGNFNCHNFAMTSYFQLLQWQFISSSDRKDLEGRLRYNIMSYSTSYSQQTIIISISIISKKLDNKQWL